MKAYTKIIASIVGFVTLALQVPAVQHAIAGFFAAHPNISALLGGIAAITALFHQPQKQG